MKKILFVVNSFSGGGAERVCMNLADAYREKGYEVDFITLYKEAGGYDIPKGYRVFSLGLDGSAPAPVTLLRVLFSKGKVNKFMSEDYELVTSHLPMANVLSGITRLNKKTIYVMHNSMSYVNRGGSSFTQKLMKRFLKGKQLVTVSEGIRQEMMQDYAIPADHIHTIYNPVTIPAEEDLAQMEPKHPRKYILMMGRLESEKQPWLGLELYQKAQLTEEYDLVYLGQGSLQGVLEDMIAEAHLQDRVFLMGFQKNAGPWIKGASLLLSTSRFEGFGMNLVEALAHHTPVVSSDCKYGPNEILVDELSRYLIDPMDDATSIEVIKNALNGYSEIKPDYYMRFERFRVADNYLTTYHQVMGEGE